MHRFAQVALFLALCLTGWADDANKAAATPVAATTTAPDVNADEIIQKFGAKEKEFAEARENYTYRQTVKIQALDDSGTPVGKYEQVSDIIFSPEGKRTEHVVYAPVSTLSDYLLLTPEDDGGLAEHATFCFDHRPASVVRHPLSGQAERGRDLVLCVSPSSPRSHAREAAISRGRSGWTIATSRS